MTASFEVTFLGHQGWLFAAGESRVLVDPLLTPAIGHGASAGVVWPPRELALDAMPPIDALVYTHEHEDHFDVPSLARVDRHVPVFLSAHSSRAAHALLEEMGFTVHRPGPGDVVTVGDLDVHLFAPDFTPDDALTGELDVLPFFVRDRRGHGSFFSSVDVQPHDGIEKALRTILEKPQIWSYTNNAADWSFTRAGNVLAGEPMDSGALARAVLDRHLALVARWGEPDAVLFCGGGMSFSGDRAWMNKNVFRADSSHVCAALSALAPGRRFVAPAPGETVSMANGAIVAPRSESAFLRAAPRAEWPSRAYVGDVSLMEIYSPFTEKRALTQPELDELRRELAGFAAFLCGTEDFRGLYSLDRAQLAGRRPTFSLVLLCDDDGGSYVQEYDPTACAFVRARAEDPVADYVAGMECWATDLLAVLRGEAVSTAISFGRSRSWSAFPERCRLQAALLGLYTHALRQPDRTLALYRRLLADCASVTPSVRASGRADLAVNGERV